MDENLPDDTIDQEDLADQLNQVRNDLAQLEEETARAEDLDTLRLLVISLIAAVRDISEVVRGLPGIPADAAAKFDGISELSSEIGA
ncbi:MAG TPA: hypothetical protein VFQ54_08680 [Thermomicrobiales bacterium]|nr:hypothetical protein [Thermomicrobiales bacterium]